MCDVDTMDAAVALAAQVWRVDDVAELLPVEVEMATFVDGARRRFVDAVHAAVRDEVWPVVLLVGSTGADRTVPATAAAGELRRLADELEAAARNRE